MKQFPEPVRRIMQQKDIAATCIPVQFEEEQWESAFFFHVDGAESKQDRRVLKKNQITPVILITELLTHENASVIMMRCEVQTIIDDPIVFEILLVPGEVEMHYECLKMLATQKRIRYFFSDSDYRVLQEQEQEISSQQHENFETLTKEAFAHDSLVRMSGKYDADAAIAEVVSHYQVRTGVDRPDGKDSH